MSEEEDLEKRVNERVKDLLEDRKHIEATAGERLVIDDIRDLLDAILVMMQLYKEKPFDGLDWTARWVVKDREDHREG